MIKGHFRRTQSSYFGSSMSCIDRVERRHTRQCEKKIQRLFVEKLLINEPNRFVSVNTTFTANSTAGVGRMSVKSLQRNAEPAAFGFQWGHLGHTFVNLLFIAMAL